MLCQHCSQRPATVHIVKQVNNQREEYHLCETCAREQGHLGLEPAFTLPNFSLQQLLSSLLESDPFTGFGGGPAAPRAELRCSFCGLTFRQFKEGGFLGCSHCYEAFASELGPLLRRVQGSDKHVGKAPRRSGGVLRLRKELAQLRAELQEAVSREEYERAAQLRDRIRDLERRIQAGGDGNAVE
ncbi:MAG: UvrB/UvrC motif-containing protein [Bacillota bacterium]|nr:MAG: hypothetical protein DIU70_01120 [Bacillota bacterium]